MLGLIEKSVRETFVATIAFAVGLGVAEGLLAFAIPTMILPYADQFMRMEFLQPFIVGLFGERLDGVFKPEAVMTVTWVHPVILAIVWGHVIWFCSRVPAGEVDRGTIDTLLGWPVSRLQVLLSETIVVVASLTFIVLVGVLANEVATQALKSEHSMPLMTTVRIAVNLAFVSWAVAGVVSAASAMTSRRGLAVGVSLAIVIGSFLISFLAQLWSPFKTIRWLSVLNYYKPIDILRHDAFPIKDTLILIVVGLAFWIIGAVAFERRDIRTV